MTASSSITKSNDDDKFLLPSRPQYATLAAAAESRGQRWWRTTSGRRFSAQRAVGRHTARPAWRRGTATGNQREGQGGMACSGSLLSPEPASAELPPPSPAPAWWLRLFGRSSPKCSTVGKAGGGGREWGYKSEREVGKMLLAVLLSYYHKVISQEPPYSKRNNPANHRSISGFACPEYCTKYEMSAEWLSAVKLDKIMQNKELCVSFSEHLCTWLDGSRELITFRNPACVAAHKEHKTRHLFSHQ